MRLGPDPAPLGAGAASDLRVLSPTGPLAFLCAVLGALLFLWLARLTAPSGRRLASVLDGLRRIRLRTKLVATVVLLGLLVGAEVAGDYAARQLSARDVEARQELVARLREAIGEAGRLGLLDAGADTGDVPVVRLLGGDSVQAPTRYDHALVPPVPETPHRTIEGTPFLRRDLPAQGARPGAYVVHPPAMPRRATFVYSWHPSAGTSTPVAEGTPIAEIRLVHEDGRVAPAVEVLAGRHVAPFADEAAAPAEARPAFTGTVPFFTGRGRAYELSVDVPREDDEAPVVRVELESRSAAGTFVLHGVTLVSDDDASPRPLPLGRATEEGIPTGAAPFPRGDALAELSAANDWVVIRDLDVPADRLWVVAALRRTPPDHRFRAPVALIEAVFDDGSVDGPFRLENGVSVEAETAPARQHAATYQAALAFEWGLPGETRRHFDVVSLPLERAGRRLVELQLRFTGEDEVLRVAGITVGAEAPLGPPADVRHLVEGPDGFRLPQPDLEALSGLSFTLYRDGSAIGTTLPGESRERTLARRLSNRQLEALESDADVGFHEQRVVDGEPQHALLTPLSGGVRGDVLEMVWRSDAAGRIGDVVAVARAVLASLLIPLLVLVAADLVLGISSLHVRLVLTFAAAAAIPIALAAFAVPQLVGAKIEGVEEEAVLEKSRAVHRRLTALRPAARQRAESALAYEGLQDALRRRDVEDYGAAIAAALRDAERLVASPEGGETRVALEVSPPPSAGTEPLVFPEQARWTVFKSPLVNISDAFAKRWSQLYASGVARRFDPDGWSTSLVVELPMEAAALQEAARAAGGGGVQVLLYSPTGFPLAATLDARDEESAAARSRKRAVLRRVLAAQQPIVETLPLKGTLYTVAYDVLREGADPVGIVATALPRAGTEALVRRVESVSLLIFGVGIVMQFLLAGLVVGGATRRFERTLGRARLAAPESADTHPHADDLTAMDEALRELRRDREVYRAELGHLHDAVEALSIARSPEQVATEALAAVRGSIAPWGALLLASADDDSVELLGGFHGASSVAPAKLRLHDDGALPRIVRGGEEWRGAAVELGSGPAHTTVTGGAERVEAYPLGGEGGTAGALLLLHDAKTHARTYHAEFAAALARHAGQALASSRLVRLAVHDQDSGAYIGTYFEQRLAGEVDDAVAARRSIAVLLLRADGVAAGQSGREERRRLAARVRERAPERAFLGQYDNNVLAVAIPETDREGAEAFARDLRRSVGELGGTLASLSTGVAACPEDAGSCEFLLAEARRALAGTVLARSGDGNALEDRQKRLVEDARALGAIFRSEKGIHLLETIERIASSDLTILIEGETGVGKEVVADLIHRKSARGAKSLVKINCAALPDTLLESELFGYEPGAFTGADRRKPGRFELADGGTIFLDEIGEMPHATQVKLLRVLEDRVVEHLGGTRPIPVDVRVIAATNRELRGEIAAGRFREDLYYRLNAVGIAVPPLRARKEDIPALAKEMVRRAAESAGRRPPEIAPDAMDVLYRHPWPGNVRELRNALEQAVVLSAGDVLRGADIRPALQASTARWASTARPARGADTAGATGADELSDRQRRLLQLLGEREWMTNTEYCDLVGISTRTGLRDLKDLMARGLIHMEGKRRGARYRLR
jgi:two-component system response regulator HydG